GGYLATVAGPEENSFILALTQGHTAWLGGSDQASEGNWQWVDGQQTGQAFTYTNWNQNEPNNLDHAPYNIGENFLQFLANGTWNDEQGPVVASAATTDGYV